MDREKKIEIAKIILMVVSWAGLLPVALVARDAVKMFEIFADKKSYQLKFRFNRALKELRDKGLIKIKYRKAELTPAGKKELAFYELKSKSIQKPKKWDGKWRIVIFDVWERRRVVRDAIRKRLGKFGFVRLQNSVWVYPYECQEVVELLKTYYKLRPAVLYIVAETIENDKGLRKKFGLRLPEE